MSCKHTTLQLTPSAFARLAGYEQPDSRQRAAAETRSGQVPKKPVEVSPRIFPAPLVVPHGDLNYDPDCSPQSTRSWMYAKTRNKMTPESGRGTLYIASVPDIGEDVSFMCGWTVPAIDHADKGAKAGDVASPNVELFVGYLKAFYHGLDVKILPAKLSWMAWGQ